MAQLKILTLNIERDKHLEVVNSFIERESPDVFCVQEIFERDFNVLKNKFGFQGLFIPMCKIIDSEKLTQIIGVALLSKLPIENGNKVYYHKPSEEINFYTNRTLEEKYASIHHGIIWGNINKDGTEFTIGTTHFTWTPNGMPDKYQEEDLKNLFKILDNIPDLVLCGDFNIPRKYNYLYNKLVNRFKDNIPDEIKTTLTMSKHKSRINPVEAERVGTYVVDYIFSTPKYTVNNVKCEYEISDHAAIIGVVSI